MYDIIKIAVFVQYNQILYKITKISEIGDVKLEKLIEVEFVYMTKTDK